MGLVEAGPFLNLAGQRRSHHAANHLGDRGGVLRSTEREHDLGSWTVPPSAQAAFEEDDAGVLIGGDLRGFDIADLPSVDHQVGARSEAVDKSLISKRTDHIGQDVNDRAEVGLGDLPISGGGGVLILHLDDEGGDYQGFIAIGRGEVSVVGGPLLGRVLPSLGRHPQ